MVRDKAYSHKLEAVRMGRYDVTCKYCQKNILDNSSLSYHMLVNHYFILTEDDFNFIDNYFPKSNLSKSKVSREKFVKLEIKFNKINYTPEMNMEQLNNYDEILTRRQVRVGKTIRQYRKLPQVEKRPPSTLPQLETDDQMVGQLPPLELSDDENDLESLLEAINADADAASPASASAASVSAATSVPAATAAPAAAAAPTKSLHGLTIPSTLKPFVVPPDFELNNIPTQLLFSDTTTVSEPPNMKCRYCGLNFNRYRLSEHLLRNHYDLIDMNDLDFVKNNISKGSNLLRNIHIILKVHQKIIARDKRNYENTHPPMNLLDNIMDIDINEFDPKLFE